MPHDGSDFSYLLLSSETITSHQLIPNPRVKGGVSQEAGGKRQLGKGKFTFLFLYSINRVEILIPNRTKNGDFDVVSRFMQQLLVVEKT